MPAISSTKGPKWGILVGSKKKLRQVLTGEPPSKEESETLAGDLLFGAIAISRETGLTVPQVYHQQKALGLVRLGRTKDAA
jgi:hypothetical protein